MVLEFEKINGTMVVTLPRRFDTDHAPQFEMEMEPVIGEHPERVLFDFAKTDYISSAGVRTLLKLTRAITDGGGISALSSLSHHTEYVLEITGFTKVFTIYRSMEIALKRMRKKG